MLTLIDTDVLIDVGHDVEIAVSTLQNIESSSDPAISIITQMELVVGCRNKVELRELNGFLERFYIINLDQNISYIALELLKQYRLSHGLLIPDGLIAAAAIEMDIPLISKNQRDFRFIDRLNLLPYPKP